MMIKAVLVNIYIHNKSNKQVLLNKSGDKIQRTIPGHIYFHGSTAPVRIGNAKSISLHTIWWLLLRIHAAILLISIGKIGHWNWRPTLQTSPNPEIDSPDTTLSIVIVIDIHGHTWFILSQPLSKMQARTKVMFAMIFRKYWDFYSIFMRNLIIWSRDKVVVISQIAFLYLSPHRKIVVFLFEYRWYRFLKSHQ